MTSAFRGGRSFRALVFAMVLIPALSMVGVGAAGASVSGCAELVPIATLHVREWYIIDGIRILSPPLATVKESASWCWDTSSSIVGTPSIGYSVEGITPGWGFDWSITPTATGLAADMSAYVAYENVSVHFTPPKQSAFENSGAERITLRAGGAYSHVMYDTSPDLRLRANMPPTTVSFDPTCPLNGSGASFSFGGTIGDRIRILTTGFATGTGLGVNRPDGSPYLLTSTSATNANGLSVTFDATGTWSITLIPSCNDLSGGTVQLLTLAPQAFYFVSAACAGGGEVCATDFPVVLTRQLTGISFQASALHCSDIAISLYFDGRFIGTSPFLAPGGMSPVYIVGIPSAATHTVSIVATGRIGGCNVGELRAWEGSLIINTPFKT
jgi:hypothetical protein